LPLLLPPLLLPPPPSPPSAPLPKTLPVAPEHAATATKTTAPKADLTTLAIAKALLKFDRAPRRAGQMLSVQAYG
jgi:hypothetical protein